MTCKMVITFFVIFSISSFVARGENAPDDEFCWRNSYGRGVGTIPDECAWGQEKIGLLCYSQCPRGYARYGLDCHQKCPTTMADQGLFCRNPEYGRGWGFPFWGWDSCMNDALAKSSGGCEWCLAMIYPKCKPGYSPVGCNICRPNTPNCAALGLGFQFDLSCAKKIIIGDPKTMICKSGTVYDAGLCYIPCAEAFNGVGPVCWGKAPTGWVECGFGASTNSPKCAEIISDQIFAVMEMVSFVVSLGSSAIVKGSTSALKAVEKFKELQSKVPDLFELADNAAAMDELVAGTMTVTEFVAADPDTMEPEEVVRQIASLSALFDPTGVSSVVAAFAYASCDQLF